jgi:hypothetical protein
MMVTGLALHKGLAIAGAFLRILLAEDGRNQQRVFFLFNSNHVVHSFVVRFDAADISVSACVTRLHM